MIQEVHRWRGTAEQRAQRDSVRKFGQFAYFDAQLDHPDWRGKKVLDFGGSDGNLLLNDDCVIRHDDYHCLDIVRDAIEEGRRNFPAAHWHHYDRYNCSFNPTGIPGFAIPDLGVPFDVILAYSVFTHTTREEMHELVGQLYAQLAPGGILAFTFEDPHFNPWPATYHGDNLRWRLEACRESNPAVNVDFLSEKGRGAEWCALVGGTELYVNGNGAWENEAETCLTYDVYHTVAFMQRQFPAAEIRLPVNDEMQHCCILRRPA